MDNENIIEIPTALNSAFIKEQETEARLAGYMEPNEKYLMGIHDQFEPDAFPDYFFHSKNKTRLFRLSLFKRHLPASIDSALLDYWRRILNAVYGAYLVNDANGVMVFEWNVRGSEGPYGIQNIASVIDGFALLESAEFNSRPLLTSVSMSVIWSGQEVNEFQLPVDEDTTSDHIAVFWAEHRFNFAVRLLGEGLKETADEAFSKDRRWGIPLILDNYIR